jgi:signal transduction histidine kinase
MQEQYNKFKLKYITEDFNNIIKDSYEGIQQVSKIVQSLLNLTIDHVDDTKDYCGVDLIINQAMLLVKREAQNIANILYHSPFQTQLYCDAGQIGQVLINLLHNSIQAIKSLNRTILGSIEIDTYEEKEFICITVKDDGPGISKENLLKIFNPFFTTKDVGEGKGLGLSISYDIIVNKHKGFMDVQSELGNGTTFTIKLPLR